MHTRASLFLSCLIFVCFAAIEPARAQSPPWTVGAQFSTLRLADSDGTNVGIGVRGSYRVTRWIEADGAFSLFPDDQFVNDPGGAQPGFGVQYERRRIELLAGPKIGLRRERVGVFGKVRPGFTRLFDRGVGCSGEVCALALFVRPVYRTEFALDLGGVVELYPSERFVARVDVGSTMIRHRSVAPPCNGCTTNNLATSVGVGWRF
jgi:hypothetical protein